MISCNTCGLNDYRKIENCPKLNTDNCSFKIINYSVKNLLFKSIISFGVFWTLISSIFFIKIIFEVKLNISSFLFPFLFALTFELIGFSTIITGLYHGYGQKKILYNKLTGETVKINTLFEKILSTSVNTKFQKLEFNFIKSGLLQYPVSISSLALKKENNANYLFSVTLIYLITNQYLEIKKSNIYKSYFNQKIKFKKEEYFLLPGNKARDKIDGKLENIIMNIVNNWNNIIEFRESPSAPSVYYLIRSIFEQDRFIPQLWIIELLGNDAAEKNLVSVVQDKLFKTENNILEKYEPFKQHYSVMKSEAMQIRSLYNNQLKNSPDFIESLKKQINNAIYSRRESTD